MEVDYVIVYRFASTTKATAIHQYQKLIETLAAIGLIAEVRNGEKESMLIFVKLASDKHLYSEVYRSRTRDWLYGVRSAAPEQETVRTLDKEPLYPAERLRIIYEMITNPKSEGGAGITPKQGEWVGVEAVFTLHDHNFNQAWLKDLAKKYMLKIEDLDQIRNRFGEKVAFYFAFTQAYFTALIGVAILGVSSWTLLGYYSPVYGIINSILCTMFVEYWKHQEYDLAVRWGVKGVSAIETKRHSFVHEKEKTDPVTGEKVQIFPAPKRFQRQLLQIPFGIAAVLVLGALIGTSFGIEIFMTEIYNGPMKSILVFLPTGIMTTTQPLILGLLSKIAERLTDYENYETESEYDAALTSKMFVLNFITSYLPLFLTAFIYVPFAELLVPFLDVFALTVRPFAENEKQMTVPSSGFHINTARLRKQVIYFTFTAQIVNMALEIIVPYVKQRGFSKYKEIQIDLATKRGVSVQDVSASDLPEEAEFLKQVRSEAERTVYDVTTDIREMVVQFGYLALFSVVWPLTGVSFLANNWLELRTDAVKICLESQRPRPTRADSIGPWLNTLSLLSWMGSITTGALVYLFRNDGLGPDGSPKDITGWALLLSILFAEHAYLGAQWLIRYFVSKLDSPGRRKERAARYSIRKAYLEENIAEQSARVAPKIAQEPINRTSLEREARESTLESSTAASRFWTKQRNWQETVQMGARLIEATAADEAKKEQ